MVPEVVAEVVGPVSSKVEEDSRLGRYLSEHLGRGALKLPSGSSLLGPDTFLLQFL